MDLRRSPTPQSPSTHFDSSPSLNRLSSPTTHVDEFELDRYNNKAVDGQPTITTIQTNFQKSLNTEFKPGGTVSQDELIALTELERNVAEAAIVPHNLDDFIEKVILLYSFQFRLVLTFS